MFKKIISVFLAVVMVFGCFSMAVSSRQVGVGGGAESFCPVEFSQAADIIGTTTVNTSFTATITDNNYKVKINSVSVAMPFLAEGDTSSLTVSYSTDTVVEETISFSVTGHITESTNSVARYTVNYDVLDKSGKTVWKNLTGYAYGKVSGSAARTGAIGTVPPDPGDIGYGARFTSLDKLNSCYVQVPSMALNYELKTQHFLITFRERRTDTQVIAGNAPSTLRTYSVNWPSTQWYWQDAAGTWLMWAIPDSGYYNFTVDMNANNEEWKEEENTVLSTEMYYLSDYDKNTAKQVADKMLALNKTFSQGYYVQKGRYTEESWNSFVSALDSAYQVALAVPGPTYGFKLACQNGKMADETLLNAFGNLQEAPCDWTSYKDPIIGEEATCGSGGTQIFTCICGKTKVESTSTIACTPDDEWTVTIEPTCTTPGEEAQLCIKCSNPVNRREVAALGHEYNAVVTPPACLDEGYTTYTCIRGDHTYKDDFTPAKGHTPGKVEYNYPTAILDGYKMIYCSDCDTFLSTETIAKPQGKFVLTAHSDNKTFFTGVLDSDLNVSLSVPKNSTVNTGSVSTALAVADIPSLEIEDTVTYQSSSASQSGEEIALDDYLGVFESATVSGVVRSKDAMREITEVGYQYNLTSNDTDDLYVINAVSENQDDATAAFAAFTSHITSEKIRKDDRLPEDEELLNLITNYIKLPGSAYIQVGTDKLTFENPDEVYMFSKTEEKPTFKFEEVEETDAQVEIYLPVGTIFAIGNHKLTIHDFLTIKLSGCNESDVVNGLISDIQNCQSSAEVSETVILFFAELLSSANGNDIVLDFIFDPAGYVVSGTVETFKPYEEADGTEITTIEFMQNGERIKIVSVEGEGVKNFTFDSVPNGIYTVRVMKINHVEREYEVVVNNEEIMGLELKIHLPGDLDGNGKVNVIDYSAVLRHVKKTDKLEGYEYACADIDYNGKLNLLDYSAILRHVKKVAPLW